MSSTLLAVLLGIIGGAVASGMVQAVMARLDRNRASRGAARLLYGELLVMQQRVKQALIAGDWGRRSDWTTFATAWAETKAAMVGALDARIALPLVGYAAVTDLVAQVHTVEAGKPLDAGARQILEASLAYINAATAIAYLASFTWWERRRKVHLQPDLVPSLD